MSDLPVKPRKPGKHILTHTEKEYTNSFAVDGVIPLPDYIKAVNKILNRN